MRALLPHPSTLISNALKYAPWVDIRLDKTHGEILVYVTDGGQGLASDDCEGIWDLGYRAKNRKSTSSGIGLPYAKLIVQAHGGRIGVHSTIDEGSEFYFSLPQKLVLTQTNQTLSSVT
jgi:signal transduction histidine kinase